MPTSATDHTTLFYLLLISDTPSDWDRSQIFVRRGAIFRRMAGGTRVRPDVWLANIGVKVNLRIKRIDFIRISGDIGKHNFLRLAGQAKRIRIILAENEVNIDEGEAYLAIPDAWEWFHTHLFAFHASNIAEFLNNIRYAIRDYIAPVARAAFVRIDEVRYKFEQPDGIRDRFARASTSSCFSLR